MKPPPREWALGSNLVATFSITTGAVGAQNLRLVHSTLQEPTTREMLQPPRLLLCRSGAATCDSTINVPANTTQRLELRSGKERPGPGSYTGSTFLAADGVPELHGIDLVVHSTTSARRATGAALILLGILTAWLVSVFLRNRALRAQALLPFTRLADEVRTLRAEAQNVEQRTGTTLVGMRTRLDRLDDQLSPASLEAQGLIPARLTDAFRPFQADAVRVQAALTATGTSVAVVRIILYGMRWLAGRWEVPPRPAHETALEKLDNGAAVLGTEAEASALVQAVIQALSAADDREGARALEHREPTTLQEVRVELYAINAWAWALWGLVTWVGAIAALIVANPGFGSPSDFIRCFFWGLGIQIAGQQFQQLSPGLVATTLNVSLPRAS